jgi:hypothetical protein
VPGLSVPPTPGSRATWRCLHAMQSANRDCNHAITMAIIQQRHVRQSTAVGVLQPIQYYFNVIIYLSIYELGARHSFYRCMDYAPPPATVRTDFSVSLVPIVNRILKLYGTTTTYNVPWKSFPVGRTPTVRLLSLALCGSWATSSQCERSHCPSQPGWCDSASGRFQLRAVSAFQSSDSSAHATAGKLRLPALQHQNEGKGCPEC